MHTITPAPPQVLQLAHRVYMAQHKYHDALRVALRLNEPATIEATFAACSDVLERRQLGYLLARRGAAPGVRSGSSATAPHASCIGPHRGLCVRWWFALLQDEAEREALHEIISSIRARHVKTTLMSTLLWLPVCILIYCLQDEAEREALREIISNSKLSEHFLALARDLDVMEPKVPEDVYKSHLTGALRVFF